MLKLYSRVINRQREEEEEEVRIRVRLISSGFFPREIIIRDGIAKSYSTLLRNPWVSRFEKIVLGRIQRVLNRACVKSNDLKKKKEKVGDGIIYSAFFHPVTKLSSNLDTWFRIKFRLNVLSDLIGFSRPSVWCKLVYLSIGIPLLRINRLWLAAQTRIRTISCQGNLFNSGLNENFCIIFRIPWK